MQYRDFGNIGIKISLLGFGAMRLPMANINGNTEVLG
ncbi:MAG: aldo/keto reductase [Mahella sp.]|nr:aldo/keto reductase [Mahella sp.]